MRSSAVACEIAASVRARRTASGRVARSMSAARRWGSSSGWKATMSQTTTTVGIVVAQAVR
jgi:hypothetical protein